MPLACYLIFCSASRNTDTFKRNNAKPFYWRTFFDNSTVLLLSLMEIEELERTGRHCQRFSYLRLRTVIFITAVTLLAGFISGIVYQQHSGRKDNSSPTLAQSSGGVSQQVGDMEQIYTLDGIDLRINTNGSCKGPSCFQCRTDVLFEVVHGTPKTCQKSRYVVNASCFLCGSTCKTLQDLLNTTDTRLNCSRPVRFDCCHLAQMGDLSGICGKDGQYSCYASNVHKTHGVNEREPICKCPPGRHGSRCQEESKVPVTCKCYKGGYKFCDEETILNCNSDHAPSWTRCHTFINRYGEDMNCICDRIGGDDENESDDDKANIPNCFVPLTGAQANNSNMAVKTDGRRIPIILLVMITFIASNG